MPVFRGSNFKNQQYLLALRSWTLVTYFQMSVPLEQRERGTRRAKPALRLPWCPPA